MTMDSLVLSEGSTRMSNCTIIVISVKPLMGNVLVTLPHSLTQRNFTHKEVIAISKNPSQEQEVRILLITAHLGR